MKRKIITDLNFLKQKSTSATPFEIKSIIKDLEDSLDVGRGIGLSAIQIGINKRVAIIRTKGEKIDLVNPIIVEKSEKILVKKEGCLSLPYLYIDTRRYNKVIITCDNFTLKRYKGLTAIAIQHETDHLNGLTILDRKWRKRR